MTSPSAIFNSGSLLLPLLTKTTSDLITVLSINDSIYNVHVQVGKVELLRPRAKHVEAHMGELAIWRKFMNAEARTADLLRRMPNIRQEILEKIDRGELGPVEQLGVAASDLRTFVEGKPLRGGLESAGQETPRQRALEAIVRRFGRPVLLIQTDT